MSSQKFRYILYFLMSLALAACKNDVPDGILSDEDMENVLYDYHTAQKLGRNPAAAELTGDKSVAYNENYYVRAALKKHHLTEADFDRSLQWYTRHSDRLFNIYKKLDERMSAEMGAQVASSSGSKARETQGDTANIWQGAQSVLLTSVGNNRMTFEQKADTLLKEGDNLQLNFNTHWIYREGSKTAVAQLVLVYPNDSVQCVTRNFGASGYQSLSIRVGKKPVQAIRGFIYQQVEWSDKPKILTLTNINLLRLRSGQKASPVAPEASNEMPIGSEPLPLKEKKIDPTAIRKLRDSLQRADSAREKLPRFK